MIPLLMIYTPSLDGFAAAWVIWQRMGCSCAFRPFVLEDDYKDSYLNMYQEIVLAGASLRPETEEEWMRQARRHTSFSATPERSLALAVWEHLHGRQSPPELVRRIQDAVSGAWAMPDARDYLAGLRRLPLQQFADWERLMSHPDVLIEFGRGWEGPVDPHEPYAPPRPNDEELLNHVRTISALRLVRTETETKETPCQTN